METESAAVEPETEERIVSPEIEAETETELATVESEAAKEVAEGAAAVATTVEDEVAEELAEKTPAVDFAQAETAESAAKIDLPEIEQKLIDGAVDAEISEVLEVVPEEAEHVSGDVFVPIERATLEEIMEQVKKDGDNVTVTKDEITGITIVDYSEVI